MACCLLLVVCLLSTPANAFLAFKPNCTYPPEIVNYVSNPQIRGTLQLLWSCVSVLLLCTWSIQHLSVPLEHDRSRAPSRVRRAGLLLFSGFTKLFRLKPKPILWNEFFDEVRWNLNRAKWMILVLMAPEFYFAKALTENQAANDSRKELRAEFGHEDWSTMHAFFANMRGFIMRFETTAVPISLEPQKPTEEGRELAKPRPGGVPTVYHEQDATQAEETELKHCREFCDEECPYRRGDHAILGEKRPSLNVIKTSRRAAIERSWSDGSLEMSKPKMQTAFLASINTALFSYGSDSPSSAIPMSGATLINSPLSSRQRWLDETVGRPLARAPTVQSQAIAEENEDQRDPLSRDETLIASPVQLSDRLRSSESTITRPKLIPHKPWIGTWPLNAAQLFHAYKIGLVPAPPYLSSPQLKNQSKADVLIKILTVWQVLWLVIEILARSAEKPSIPTSLLEITVLAFAVTAITTYILLWHKPQDVKVGHEVHALRPITREDVIQLAARAPLSTLMVYEFWLHGVAVRGMGDGVFPFTRGIQLPSISIKELLSARHWIRRYRAGRACRWRRKQPGNHSHQQQEQGEDQTEQAETIADQKEPSYINTVPLGLSLGGALFGAVHLAGADFHFPTPIERTLWIISCSVLVGLPSVMVGIYSGYMHYTKEALGQERDDSKVNAVLTWFGRVLIPLYLLARIYLLVEVVRSLVYSPVGVWQVVQWPSVIPHYM